MNIILLVYIIGVIISGIIAFQWALENISDRIQFEGHKTGGHINKYVIFEIVIETLRSWLFMTLLSWIYVLFILFVYIYILYLVKTKRRV